MVDRPLDRAAAALNMSIAQADVTVAALQAAFEIHGKLYSYDKTAKIIFDAVKRPEADDPDVQNAALWLK